MTILSALREARLALQYGQDLDYEQFMVARGDAANLCGEFDEGGCPTRRGIERAERFIARARNWTPVAWWLYGIWCGARTARSILTCEVAGHAYADHSQFGPDSGAEHICCTRCGWSFSHTYY